MEKMPSFLAQVFIHKVQYINTRIIPPLLWKDGILIWLFHVHNALKILCIQFLEML